MVKDWRREENLTSQAKLKNVSGGATRAARASTTSFVVSKYHYIHFVRLIDITHILKSTKHHEVREKLIAIVKI